MVRILFIELSNKKFTKKFNDEIKSLPKSLTMRKSLMIKFFKKEFLIGQ